MNQQLHDDEPDVRRDASSRRRVANLAAQLVGGAGLAFGAISTLAKRRRDKHDGDAGEDGAARREERRAARESDNADEKADKREARQERRDALDGDSNREDNARHESVDHAQRAGRKNNNNNDNSDSEDTDEDDDGGNGRGNAGSGFFDSPLARKTQRRAKDFDNNRDRDDEPRDDNTIGEVDDNGQQHYETNAISFTNGPDGLEVITGNIEYSAPPTPTPTPFPTLTLPERDRLDVFGDRVIAAPTPAPSDGGTSNGSAPPPSTDSGTSGSTGSRPSPTPSTGDTSGGDNTSDFLS